MGGKDGGKGTTSRLSAGSRSPSPVLGPVGAGARCLLAPLHRRVRPLRPSAPRPARAAQHSALRCGRRDSGHGHGQSTPAPGQAHNSTRTLPPAPRSSREKPPFSPLSASFFPPRRGPARSLRGHRLASPGSRRCRRCSGLVPLTFPGQILACAGSRDAVLPLPVLPLAAVPPPGRGGGREPLTGAADGRSAPSGRAAGDRCALPAPSGRGGFQGTRVPPSLTRHVAMPVASATLVKSWDGCCWKGTSRTRVLTMDRDTFH